MARNYVWKVLLFFFLVAVTQTSCDEEELHHTQPLYKYRIQTEDMMKTSASSIPVRGYHVVEGNYYPAESGLIGSSLGPIGVGGGKFIGPIGAGVGSLGYGGIGLGPGEIGFGPGGIGLEGGSLGYGGHFIGGGGVGPGISAIGLGGGVGLSGPGVGVGGGGYIAPVVHGFGGEVVEKNEFSGDKKNVNDAKYQKAHGNKGEQVNHGQAGYSSGAQQVSDAKGENGYYSNAAGGKNVIQDGKHYEGGQSYNQEGKNGLANNVKTGHKKGHVIKGFKTSHHKDESGKTEEYYDESHDEGSNQAFKGENGAYGQKGVSTYNGGHQDGKFNEQEQKKSGHLSNQYAVNKQSADKGQYGENKYANGGSVYGLNNGFDQQSLLGHQENARFFKHHPVPFYHHY